MARCEWKIRWTFGQDARCEHDEHVTGLRVIPEAGGLFSIEYSDSGGHDGEHRAVLRDFAYPGSQTGLTWRAGDRREFAGDWPGPCTGRVAGCTLHAGHHGRCQP